MCSARRISRPRSPPARASATSSTASTSCAIDGGSRMPLSIHALRPGFVGEASGIDCRKPLSAQAIDAVEAGMNEHAVLVFRDQRLGPGIADFSNLDKHGNIMSGEDRVWFFKLGDRLWHSDSSFRPIPAKYSLLSARVLPSWGANTEFADMRAAYDALDERTTAEVEDLICEHSLIYSREAIGFTDLTAEEITAFQPVRQRLVRTHPATGRKSLFLSSHAGTIVGWTIAEARMFLRDLTEHATQREFVYSHAWRPDDLVMWDNRATMHRARRFDRTEIRDLRRTTLAGDAPTIS